MSAQPQSCYLLNLVLGCQLLMMRTIAEQNIFICTTTSLVTFMTKLLEPCWEKCWVEMYKWPLRLFHITERRRRKQQLTADLGAISTVMFFHFTSLFSPTPLCQVPCVKIKLVFIKSFCKWCKWEKELPCFVMQTTSSADTRTLFYHHIGS